MQRDLYNSIEHFLDDAGFRAWVLAGDESEDWVAWLEQNPHKLPLVQDARHMLLAVGGRPGEPDRISTERALSDTWSKIQETAQAVHAPIHWWKYAAAILILAVGASWLLFFNETRLMQPDQAQATLSASSERIRVQNLTDAPKTVNLEDGSSAILQPGSTLSYPSAFEPLTREVYLSGEAFFEISKNPERPFLVYTHDLVTRVVGTSFTIKAIEGQPKVEVFVKTGEVNVRQLKPESERTAPKEVALRQNESASFDRVGNAFEKKTTRDIATSATEEISFEFTDTPVALIFGAIEAVYGYQVDFPKERLRDCYLSTSLSDEPLLEKLKIICESLDPESKFTIRDDQSILIETKGCN